MLGVVGKPVIDHVGDEQIRGRYVHCTLGWWTRHTDLEFNVQIGRPLQLNIAKDLSSDSIAVVDLHLASYHSWHTAVHWIFPSNVMIVDNL